MPLPLLAISSNIQTFHVLNIRTSTCHTVREIAVHYARKILARISVALTSALALRV